MGVIIVRRNQTLHNHQTHKQGVGTWFSFEHFPHEKVEGFILDDMGNGGHFCPVLGIL